MQMEKKKQKETPKASSGGGDLMSDLASMLTMRRRGIAGSGGQYTQDLSSRHRTVNQDCFKLEENLRTHAPTDYNIGRYYAPHFSYPVFLQ